MHRGIAQLVEYWSPKPWVVGSSPSAPAKTKRSPIGDLFVLAEIEGTRKRVQAARKVPDSAFGERLEFRAKRGGVQSPSAPAKKRTKQSLRSFFIQSEGLVCNHPQGVWNRRRRMASRASVYLSFGLMPYITS